MLVELTHVSPLALAPVLIGVLTLFGKKKKDEKAEEPKQQPKTAEQAKPLTDTGHGGVGSRIVGPPSEIEDTSLNKILEMLMQDIPVSQSGETEQAPAISRTTPDWVPHRITPHSRPMVILPSEKSKKPGEEPLQTRAGQAPLPAGAHPETSGDKIVEQSIPSFPRLAGLEEEMKELEEEVKKKLQTPEKGLKPEKTVVAAKEPKPEKREPEKPPSRKPAIGSEHIFEMTQGALKSPGLVLVSGPQGSGKTTLCSSLTAGNLQKGNPCLLVTYDQSPTDAREAVRKLGCNVSNYESQFRFLLIDAFSAQTESFSMEPYYIEKPFDLTSLQETLVRNVQIFMGERVTVILDSIDGFLSKVPAKEFVKGFRETVEKLKESGAILLATADSAKLSKDFEGPLHETADCSIELEKSGSNGGRIKVRKVGGSNVKSDAEAFELDQAKGLVFV